MAEEDKRPKCEIDGIEQLVRLAITQEKLPKNIYDDIEYERTVAASIGAEVRATCERGAVLGPQVTECINQAVDMAKEAGESANQYNQQPLNAKAAIYAGAKARKCLDK